MTKLRRLQPLPHKAKQFDGLCNCKVICVGTLTLGHAPASSLNELVRITKPTGHIVYTLRPDIYEEKGFKEIQNGLESVGMWRLVEVSEEIQVLPKGELDVYHQVWVYQVI